MADIKYCKVRTNYPGTISGDHTLIDRIRASDVVKIIDMETKVTLAHEDPAVLIARSREIYMQNPKVKILVIPFTLGRHYSPPKPEPKVVLRKAKR